MPPMVTSLHPFVSDAKAKWVLVQTILTWFSKIIDTAYKYSDGIIKYRQDRANKKYKIEKAEKEALSFIKEQKNKKKTTNKVL
jgi:hypothetical protein